MSSQASSNSPFTYALPHSAAKLKALRQIPLDEQDGDLKRVLCAQDIVDKHINRLLVCKLFDVDISEQQHINILAALIKVALTNPHKMENDMLPIEHLDKPVLEQGFFSNDNTTWQFEPAIERRIETGESILPFMQLVSMTGENLISSNTKYWAAVSRSYALAKAALKLLEVIPEDKLRIELDSEHVCTKEDIELFCMSGLSLFAALLAGDSYGSANEQKLRQEAQAASERLLELKPNDATVYYYAAGNFRLIHDGKKTLMLSERGIQLAQAANQPYTETLLRIMACNAIVFDNEGEYYTTFQLQKAFEAAEEPRKKCWKWLPTVMREEIRNSKSEIQLLISGTIAAGVGLHQRMPCFGSSIKLHAKATGIVPDEYQYPDLWSKNRKCGGCGKSALHLKQCSQCRRVQYCSKSCQVAHWKTHKVECKKMRDSKQHKQSV